MILKGIGYRRKTLTVFGIIGTMCVIFAALTLYLVFIKTKFMWIPMGTLFVPCYYVID